MSSSLLQGLLHIPQRPSITGTSQSDCLVSYQDNLWQGGSPQQKCSRCILQPQLTGQFYVDVKR